MTSGFRVIAIMVVLSPGPSYAQESRTTLPSILPKDWNDRDFEGRWAAYEAGRARVPGSLRNWLDALAEAKEFDVLEWIAIKDDGFLGGELLAKRGAPNWVR